MMRPSRIAATSGDPSVLLGRERRADACPSMVRGVSLRRLIGRAASSSLLVLVAVSAVAIALAVADRAADDDRRAGAAADPPDDARRRRRDDHHDDPAPARERPTGDDRVRRRHALRGRRWPTSSRRTRTGCSPRSRPTLSGADVAMVNLETAITDAAGRRIRRTTTSARPPSAFDALRAAGVDVVTMANNHGARLRPRGPGRDARGQGADPARRCVGIGANATEAYRAVDSPTVKGQRLAFFGATDVLDDWLINAWTATDTQGGLASTKDADQRPARRRRSEPRARTPTRSSSYLHWGVEGSTCPTPRQQELAAALVAAGADIVVGSHAHRVMTAGRLGRRARRLRARQLRVLQRVGTLRRHRRAARDRRPAATSTGTSGSRRGSRAGSRTC